MRPLSYSSISTYIECPLKYKLKYIDGLKEKPKPYFSFGSSLHSTLEFMYTFHPPPPTLEDVLKHYEDNWISKGYANDEEEEGYLIYGKKILTDYYNKHVEDIKPPVAVEHRFNLEVQGIPVIGFIDRVDRLEGDKAEIVDYKSGKKLFTKSQVEENEQLTFYQWAVEESIGLRVKKLTLYHLPSQTPVSSDARSQDRIDALKGKVLMVAHHIEEGDFPAKEGRFCPCDFPEYCPFYKHLYLSKESGKKKTKADIQKTIENY
jgi:DNA helicase-2/ATP-dependent DNA helicase PcrA